MSDVAYEGLDEAEGRLAEQSRPKRRRARDGSLEWVGKCETDRQGKPFPNLANAMIALRSDPAVKNSFAYDEMLSTAMLVQPVDEGGSNLSLT